MHMVYNRDLSQRLFFAAVAIFSFTGNLFFVVLIVRNRKLMKNAYHVILLSLAITDMMTGRSFKHTSNSVLTVKTITWGQWGQCIDDIYIATRKEASCCCRYC